MGAPALLNFLRDMRVTAPPRETPVKIRSAFIRMPRDEADGAMLEMVWSVEAVPVAQPSALPSDTLIDEKEAYTRLKISESTIKRMRKSGELPFERIGPGKKLVRYRLSVSPGCKTAPYHLRAIDKIKSHWYSQDLMIYKPKAENTYYCKFRRDGKPVHKSTGCTSKRDAEKWEAAYKTALAMEIVGVTQKKKAPFLKDFAADVFLPTVRIEHVKKPRTVAYYEQSVGRLTLPDSPLALKRLDEFENGDYIAYKGHLLTQNYSVSTINADLRALKRLLNVALEADVIPKVRKITLLAGANKRDFVATKVDEAEYLAASPELNNHVATLMSEMGFRPEEIHRMEWPHIRENKITVFKGKITPSTRSIDVTPAVMKVLIAKGLLDDRLRASQKWVFPAPTKEGHINSNSTKKQHLKALKIVREQRAFRLGKNVKEIEFDFVPYSIRHTAITRRAEEGNSAPDLMYWAGHADIKTTMGYIHLASQAINERVTAAREKCEVQKVVRDFAFSGEIAETVQ